MKPLTIPMSVADEITVAALTEHRQCLQAEQQAFSKSVQNGVIPDKHKEDNWFINNKMIYHITEVLKYYGN